MRCLSLIALTLLAAAASAGYSASNSTVSHADPAGAAKGIPMKHHAKGAFDVKLQKLEAYNNDEGAGLGRMSIDKQFHGDLEATSKGEMLHAGNAKDSGGYVAVERVTGSLQGKKGGFSLQHNATMTRGTPYLNIIVVPDSGSDELKGLSGALKIIIAEGGKHYYEFDYELAD